MGTRKRSFKHNQAQNAADKKARTASKLREAYVPDVEEASSPRGEKERYVNNSALSSN